MGTLQINKVNKMDNNDDDKSNNDDILISVSLIAFVVLSLSGIGCILYRKRRKKQTETKVIEAVPMDSPRSVLDDNNQEGHVNDNVGMDYEDRSNSEELFEAQDALPTKGGDGSESEELYHEKKTAEAPYTNDGTGGFDANETANGAQDVDEDDDELYENDDELYEHDETDKPQRETVTSFNETNTTITDKGSV